MSNAIQFPADILDAISKHLQAEYPQEGCGFFAGTDGNPRHVSAWLPVRNVQREQRERRFQITPEDYLRAERWADEQGLALLGIYHSHPDHPAIPSVTDLENAVPWFSYLIVTTTAIAPGAKTSWQLNNDGQFEAENLEILKLVQPITAP